MALVDGEIDRPYLVLTFDDGYMNTLTNAAPIIRQCGLRPTWFVNGAFAGGGVYYRALVAMLTRNGHAAVLAEELVGELSQCRGVATPQHCSIKPRISTRPLEG